MNRRTVIYLLVVVALAGLVRLWLCAGAEGHGVPNRGEEADFHLLAKNVAGGKGFVGADGRCTARRPPVYPLVLGITYKIFGPHKIYGRLLQVLMGTAVVFLVFPLTKKYFGTGTACTAVTLAAFNPFLITVSGYLLNENLYTLLVLGAMVLVPRPADLTAGRGGVLGAAALLAAAALTRHTAVLLAVWMLLAGLIFGAGRTRKRMKTGLLTSGLFLLLLLPWSARNYFRLGEWVGISTYGGIAYYQGNNPRAVDFSLYRGGAAPPWFLPMYDRIASATEAEGDRLAWRMGNEFLSHNWRYLPKLLWCKFYRFWRVKTDVGFTKDKSRWWWNEESILPQLARGPDVGRLYAATVFPLFAAGIALTRRRWKELLFLYGVVVTHTIMALVFFGSIRGRIPVEPVVAVFAAVTVHWAWRQLRTRRSAPARE